MIVALSLPMLTSCFKLDSLPQMRVQLLGEELGDVAEVPTRLANVISDPSLMRISLQPYPQEPVLYSDPNLATRVGIDSESRLYSPLRGQSAHC